MSRETSATQEVYERLRGDLLACRFRPGDKLKIADLCERMKVSPGAVRESLSRLTSEGFVVSEPQRGFSVAPISSSELTDLTLVRSEIESLCLRRAIAKGDVRWEAQIVASFHEWSRTWEQENSSDAAAEAHSAFHRALVAACDSRWLLRLRDILFAQSERYRRLSVPLGGDKRDLLEEHRELMNVMLARDADRAVTLIHAHFTATERVLINNNVVTHDCGEP